MFQYIWKGNTYQHSNPYHNKIKPSLDRNDKCLIDLLTGKTCLKKYLGSTTNCFRYRWNNYKHNGKIYVSSEASLQENCFEHFNSAGIMDSYIPFQLYWSIKLVEKIVLNENTSGNIPSKRWHLMAIMLKMISNL